MNTSQIIRRLGELGFQLVGSEFQHDGLSVRLESRWLAFRTGSDLAGGAAAATGEVGPWKSVHGQRVFDLPLDVLEAPQSWDEETGDAVCPLDEMLAWVRATRAGQLPTGWKPPNAQELAELLPTKALTVESGPFARQGQWRCEADRLTVSVPLLPRVPTDLSPHRRARLSELLADVQDRHRLVRMVEAKTAQEERSISAEVDLSGAPRFAAFRLVRIGLDAVRHVVSQNVSAVELLVDPAVTSTVWEISLVQELPAEGSQK